MRVSVLLMFGCSTSPAPKLESLLVLIADAGVPQNTAGGMAVDAGEIDSGTRPLFADCTGVLIEVPPNQNPCGCQNDREVCKMAGCSWQCASCSTLSPCLTGWECDRITPPYCEGLCRKSLPRCDAGFDLNEVVVEDWSCVRPPCRFRHSLFDAGIHCSIGISASDWTTTGVAPSRGISSADLGTIGCYTSRDFESDSCLSVQAEVVTSMPDGGAIRFGTAYATKPPFLYWSAAVQMFRACAPFFQAADAGYRLVWE